MLLNPFCPLGSAQILGLKATIVVLLTLLIKAKIRITAFSALGIFLLLLQTLMFLAAGGCLVLATGGGSALHQAATPLASGLRTLQSCQWPRKPFNPRFSWRRAAILNLILPTSV